MEGRGCAVVPLTKAMAARGGSAVVAQTCGMVDLQHGGSAEVASASGGFERHSLPAG